MTKPVETVLLTNVLTMLGNQDLSHFPTPLPLNNSVDSVMRTISIKGPLIKVGGSMSEVIIDTKFIINFIPTFK